MGSTTITAQVSSPEYVAYRCSKCGAVQILKLTAVANGESWHAGKASSKVRERMKESATQKAQEKLQSMRDAAAKCDFRDHQLPVHPCDKCGSTEKWMLHPTATKHYDKIDRICILVGFVSFLMIIISMFIKDSLSANIVGGLLGAYPLLASICVRIVLSIIKKKKRNSSVDSLVDSVAMMPKDSLPLVSFDPIEFCNAVTQRFGEDAETRMILGLILRDALPKQE